MQRSLTRFTQTADAEQTPNPASTPPTDQPSQPTPSTEDLFSVPDDASYPTEAIDVDADPTLSVGLCLPDGDEATVTFVCVAGSGGMGRSELESPEAAATMLSSAVGSPVVLTGGGRVVGDQRFGFGPLRSVEHEGDTIRVEVDEQQAINGSASDDTRTPILGSWQVYVPATVEEAEAVATAVRARQSGETDYFQASERRRAAKRERLFDRFQSLSPGDTVSTPAYATDLSVVSHVYDVWATGISTLRGSTDKRVHAVVVSNPRGGYYQLGIQQSCSDDRLPTCYLSRSQKGLLTPNTEFSVEEQFGADEIAIESGAQEVDTPLAIPSREADESPLPPKCRRTNIREYDGVGDNTAREVFKAAGTTCAHELAYIIYGDGDGDLDAIADAIKTSPEHNSVFDRLDRLYSDTINI